MQERSEGKQDMEFPVFAGETGALLRTTDWAATPLGPVRAWPQSLKSYVSMIMEMPSPAIIFWGPEQIQIYNDGYSVIMGPRHPRYFGAPYRECWPDTYTTIYPWMRKVLDHGEVIEVEREHIPVTRYGFEEEAYFTFTFSPLRDDDGRIAGILQPVFDVTDTVLSDRRADTLRALAVVDPFTDPVAHFVSAFAINGRDTPMVMLYLRQETSNELELAGGSQSCDKLSSSDRARLDEAARDVLRSGQATQLEGFDISSPGPALPRTRTFVLLPIPDAHSQAARGVLALGISAELHFDDKYRGYLQMAAGHVAGALQRATALQALERQRTYLNDLFLQAPAGIAVLRGPQHVFELVNPLFRRLIGQRDVVGKPLLEALPELSSQPFPRILDDVFRTGEPYVGLEMPVATEPAAGAPRKDAFFNFVYQPLTDSLGRVEGILVFCYEVTEQVLARQRSEALTAELRSEHQRKDEFLAMLAHELRNPLAPISSAAQLLQRSPSDESITTKAGQIIGRQVKHLSGLVDDLLDVSRVTRGLVTIEQQREDVKSIVSYAVEQVRSLVETRRHRLSVNLPAETAHVLGDKKRLVQILANLLDNAAKYTPEGGVIAVSVGVEEDSVVARVRDNGIGIAPELQAKVFDLFVQAERTRDRAQGGLGIGLALVRSLAQLHGGTVSCHSEGLGEGSEFVLRLPRLKEDEGSVGMTTVPAIMPGSRPKTVLVVDDNIDAAQMLGLQLRSLGHRVIIEHDSQRALEIARREAPDVCLLDIGLPDIDGNELARHLRASPQTAKSVLVAVTGYGQESDRQRSFESGFDHHLVKPPEFAMLMGILADRSVAAPKP